MHRDELARRIRAMGEVIHAGEHATAVQLGGDGPPLVALLSDVGGAEWVELRLWAAAATAVPLQVVLARNARLAYGAFCLVEGEIYLRAALALATLDEGALVRAVDALVIESFQLGDLDDEPAAIRTLFGHLA